MRDASLALLSTPTRVSGAAATLEGPIAGRVLNEDIEAFLNVPFAQPPVADLRWRAPQAPPVRTRLRDARVLGPACPQGGAAFVSEDCLQLNIWRPSTPGPHPVMVWIHGGGFINGSAVQTDGPLVYDGAAFARQGVVFVSLKYRLGALGFLAQRDLINESAEHPQTATMVCSIKLPRLNGCKTTSPVSAVIGHGSRYLEILPVDRVSAPCSLHQQPVGYSSEGSSKAAIARGIRRP